MKITQKKFKKSATSTTTNPKQIVVPIAALSLLVLSSFIAYNKLNAQNTKPLLKESHNSFHAIESSSQIETEHLEEKKYRREITLTMEGYLGGAKDPLQKQNLIHLTDKSPELTAFEANSEIKTITIDEDYNILSEESVSAENYAKNLQQELESQIMIREDGQKFIIVAFNELSQNDTTTEVAETYDTMAPLIAEGKDPVTKYEKLTFTNSLHEQYKNQFMYEDSQLAITESDQPFVQEIYITEGEVNQVGLLNTLRDYVINTTSSEIGTRYNIKLDNGQIIPATPGQKHKIQERLEREDSTQRPPFGDTKITSSPLFSVL